MFVSSVLCNLMTRAQSEMNICNVTQQRKKIKIKNLDEDREIVRAVIPESDVSLKVFSFNHLG